jgi:hypothetical protein
MVGVPWIGLSSIVAPMRRLVAAAPAALPLRERAAWVAGEHFGYDVLASDPSAINIGALAVVSNAAPPLYQCRPSASRVVHDTDLHSIPGEAPPLLRSAGIIEARRPETGERLWGDVASLGWYPIAAADRGAGALLDAIMLVGLSYPDGAIVASWMPAWTGEDLAEQLPYPDVQSSLIDALDLAAHTEFARQAARYLIVFGLLEKIEDGPLRFEIDKRTRVRAVRTRDLSAKGHVAGPVMPRQDPVTALDPRARALADTMVRGHLKRVRVGAGRERIRWVYVEAYGSRRWMAPRWTVERDHSAGGLANSSLIYRPT